MYIEPPLKDIGAAPSKESRRHRLRYEPAAMQAHAFGCTARATAPAEHCAVV